MSAIVSKRVVAVAAAIACAPVFAQEQSYEIKVCSATEVTVIDRARDTTILASVSRGIADSVKPGGAFDKTTFECRGVTNASKTGVDYNSRCTFVDADGDRVVGATAGHAKGWSWKFLGGTGKWEGIQGGGTGRSIGAYPRLSPSVSAGCGLATGTFSIKK